MPNFYKDDQYEKFYAKNAYISYLSHIPGFSNDDMY